MVVNTEDLSGAREQNICLKWSGWAGYLSNESSAMKSLKIMPFFSLVFRECENAKMPQKYFILCQNESIYKNASFGKHFVKIPIFTQHICTDSDCVGQSPKLICIIKMNQC